MTAPAKAKRLKLYVLWDCPDAGGDGTFLANEDLGDDGWTTDRSRVMMMTASKAVQQLEEHDSGHLLRNRLQIWAARDIPTGPDMCELPRHQPGCRGDCGPEGFVCQGCKRLRGYCAGAADSMPNHCDDCFVPPASPGLRRKRWVG